ncbi:UNVERIFIED_CONTAM: hypothetical protein GTU68_067103, partial [Idotea baltica]|nr:hypothetical protein [Idotea baltica]
MTRFTTKDKFLGLTEIMRRIASWRAMGDQIVFTNGCFDLLHLGHVSYLEDASKLGHRLVIGLNTDLSVRQLKGEGRPIMDENSRGLILSGFEYVDGVVLFEEETPYKLIETIRPDVLVKGGDYELSSIVGHDLVTGYGG